MAKIPKLKRVLIGLRICMKGLTTCPKECPYYGQCEGQNKKPLMGEIYARLKVYEPRVMTLDELSEKTDVYFESLVYDTICPALSAGSYDDGTVGLMTLEDELFYMDEADYGVQCRCWTSCPTDEQREVTPWND